MQAVIDGAFALVGEVEQAACFGDRERDQPPLGARSGC
jgi:hypothetical protein